MEKWKTIKCYEGYYEVSSKGKVRSVDRFIKSGTKTVHLKGKNLLIQNSCWGYPMVALTKNCKQKRFTVHRLVALAFIPNPNNYSCVNHKDENKQNNSVENLEWCTHKYNDNYGTRNERRAIKQRNNDRSYPVAQFTLAGNFVAFYPSICEARRQTGISESSIRTCALGKYKTGRGFIWKYI